MGLGLNDAAFRCRPVPSCAVSASRIARWLWGHLRPLLRRDRGKRRRLTFSQPDRQGLAALAGAAASRTHFLVKLDLAAPASFLSAA